MSFIIKACSQLSYGCYIWSQFGLNLQPCNWTHERFAKCISTVFNHIQCNLYLYFPQLSANGQINTTVYFIHVCKNVYIHFTLPHWLICINSFIQLTHCGRIVEIISVWLSIFKELFIFLQVHSSQKICVVNDI